MPCNSLLDLAGNELENRLLAASGNDRIPLYCQWEITCRCNLKCVMCYTDCFNTREDIQKELSTPEILRIMDELRDAGVLELTLTGGEPMAHPNFSEIYTHAVKCGFLVTVFTNGTYINPETIRLFNDYTPTMIEISYLGAKKATFDRATQMEGSFERVRDGIRLILENDLPLTIKTTALTLNQEELLEIKKWVRSLRCHSRESGNLDSPVKPENDNLGNPVYFRFGTVLRRLANGDNSSKHYQIPNEKLDSIIGSDAELARDQEKQYEILEQSQGCHSGLKRFHIDAYGNLQLCSDNREKGYSLRTGSFKEGFFNHLPEFPCSMKEVTHV